MTSPVRIVHVDSTERPTRAIAEQLNALGLQAQVDRALTREDLRQMLARVPLDLVLVCDHSVQAVEPGEVSRMLAEHGMAAPVVYLPDGDCRKIAAALATVLRVRTGQAGLPSGCSVVAELAPARPSSAPRYREVFESIGLGVLVLNGEMRVLESNDFARKAFPQLRSGSKQRCYEALLEDARGGPCANCPVVEALKTGRRCEGVVHRNGSRGERSYRIVACPMRRDGRLVGATAVVEDVSARQCVSEQLGQSARLEALGRLAGGVAHDFNNLLVAINGYAQLVRDSLEPDDRRHEDLDEILNAGERAAALSRQLLAFSRRKGLSREETSLNTVLDGMRKMLRRLISENVEIRIEMADDVPLVLADTGRVEQIILNLALNARDAMPDGGTLKIETARAQLDADYCDSHPEVQPGLYAVLAVTDTGRGMDAETCEEIFEPFFTTKAKGQGTGLGLATVYGAVKQHGGHIWFYSEPGRGTRFKVYLPAITPADDAGEGPDGGEAVLRGDECVLLVEDSDQVRCIVERALQRYGYEVLCAADPAEAEQLFARQRDRIQILVTDVVMPGANGIDLSRRLRATRPGLRALYMSGYADEALSQRLAMDGLSGLLEKPFSARELVARVREVLDR